MLHKSPLYDSYDDPASFIFKKFKLSETPCSKSGKFDFGHSEKARKTSHIYCLTLRKVFLDVIVKLQLKCGFDKNVAVTLVF